MDYLYGKLNEQVHMDTYTGKDTDTASVIVDNTDNTISVNVKTDTVMSDTSTNPVQNKIIKAYIDAAIEALRAEFAENLTAAESVIRDVELAK